MLTYEEFKSAFCAKFPEMMGPEFAGYEMKMMPVVKKGKCLDGFTFCQQNDSKKVSVMPSYYFDDIYRSYCRDEDLSRSLYEICASMKNCLQNGPLVPEDVNLTNIKKNVIAELMSRYTASECMDTVPHRMYEDMYIVYRWVVKLDDNGVFSTLIDNNLMDAINITEDELYKCAMVNTKRLIVPQIKTLDSVIRQMMRKEGKTDREIRKSLGKADKDTRIYILTNKQNFRASTAIMFDSVRRKIADKLESDFYVVPTSVNESLIVPATCDIDPSRLWQMLAESNAYYLGDEDQILSDSIYYYSAESGELQGMRFGEVRV